MKLPDGKELDEIKQTLRQLVGEDCYAEVVLFPDGDTDRDALRWLYEILTKIVNNKRPNTDKAKRVLALFHRVTARGYIDHLLMHQGAKAIEDNEKLRETVDHLATKLSEK